MDRILSWLPYLKRNKKRILTLAPFNPLKHALLHVLSSAELPENWTDTRETLVEGMVFQLKYLGVTMVEQPKGEELSAAAVKRIVATVREQHTPTHSGQEQLKHTAPKISCQRTTILKTIHRKQVSLKPI